ncbi:MAG: serine hydrolase [Acidobacteriota bacterium]
MRAWPTLRLLLLVLPLWFSSSSHGQTEPGAIEPKDKEWPTASPADVDIDPEPLARLISELPAERKHGLHSLLIARRGQLVFEQYWNGHDRDTVQDARSATKSITSLLLGIALDRGLVGAVSDPLLPYLDDAYPDLAQSGTEKAGITLAHLLTMSSGLDCDDRDRKTKGQEDRMYRRRDWVRYFLELGVVHPPGEVGRYCTGGVVALGRVIAEASGLAIPEFARQHLFGPLGFRGERWSRFDRDRQTDTGGHLYLRPRDMAKIGQLVLQAGQWNGSQLVPAAWIERATQEHIRLDGGRPYGYLWWFAGLQVGARQHKVIFASGNGGQLIYIVPDLELVVVFTGGNYNSPKARLPFELLGKYVVPAVLE